MTQAEKRNLRNQKLPRNNKKMKYLPEVNILLKTFIPGCIQKLSNRLLFIEAEFKMAKDIKKKYKS